MRVFCFWTGQNKKGWITHSPKTKQNKTKQNMNNISEPMIFQGKGQRSKVIPEKWGTNELSPVMAPASCPERTFRFWHRGWNLVDTRSAGNKAKNSGKPC